MNYFRGIFLTTKLPTRIILQRLLKKQNTSCKIAVIFVCFLFNNSLFADPKPKIITSITPIASIVAMLMQDKAIITTIMTNDGCPHHYHLKPSDINKVQQADLAIYINDQFDGFAAKLLNEHNKNLIKLSDIKALNLLSKNNEYNWHIWLDLQNVKILLYELALILAQKFPDISKDIYENNKLAQKELEDLEQIKTAQLAYLPDVILLDESLEYLFYNTNTKAKMLYEHNQKSLKYLDKLKQLINNSNSKCLILTSAMDNRLYQNLNAVLVTLASENWPVAHISGQTFYNQYSKMIRDLSVCATPLLRG